MEKFEPKEYKSNSTKLHEQDAEKEKEKIKELNEKFKKIVKEAEELEEAKKKSGDLST